MKTQEWEKIFRREEVRALQEKHDSELATWAQKTSFRMRKAVR